MVTITNGIDTFRVTAGAVSIYNTMGFHVVNDEELEEMRQTEQKHHDIVKSVSDSEYINNSKEKKESIKDNISNEEAVFIEELLEKPLTQWTNDEMKEFVKIKGIDTSGVQKVSQVRGIIKSYLEEQNKNM